ncbi:MAG: DUF1593 domain-containing protein [Armatimonadota bacterium]
MAQSLLPLLTVGTALLLGALAPQAEAGRPAPPAERQRVLVLTDISNEPDDEESLVRFLVYSNEYDVEGLVATTSTWLRERTREDLIRRQIDAYAQVRSRLLKHAPGFPEADRLRAVTATGQGGFGMAAVGDGKSTPGSRRILEAADRADRRPLWISVWGGANTLAQALWDARKSRSADELKRLVGKLRVYAISDQDDAGPWLRREFPELFYIASPSDTGHQHYARATWTGISGDLHYKNGPGHKIALVQPPWLEQHVIRGHGPLGALYPKPTVIMEGDTPSFLGLVNNGLGWHVSPSYGGWGGRYVFDTFPGETRPHWTNTNGASRDRVTADDGKSYLSDQATIWRWREQYQHDFAARMDWCVAEEYAEANHNPVAVLNGDRTKRVLELRARSGETVRLSSRGSRDPDGNQLRAAWLVYPEAGSYRGEVPLTQTEGERTAFTAPKVERPETIHVILQLQDDGAPRLYSYRRAVVTVRP